MRANNVDTLIKSNISNRDIRTLLERAVKYAAYQTSDIAPMFKRGNETATCQAIYNFIRSNVKYVPDGFSYQAIKAPPRLVGSFGDCKSMSLLAAGILKNLGIQPYFRYVSYNNADKTPTHVYVVTKGGCIIDAVDGTTFNTELPYSHQITKAV